MKKMQKTRRQNETARASTARSNTPRAGRNTTASTTDTAVGRQAALAYIESLPTWKRAFARLFDELVEREIPNVRRGVKWTVPVYGIEGKGWFASFSAFTTYVKLTFFHGAAFKPPLPGGTGKTQAFLDLKEGDRLDDTLVASWIRQAAAGPGSASR